MLVECSPIKSNSPIYPVDLFAAFHGVKIAYCHYTLGRASAEPTRVSFPPQPWSGRGCINLVLRIGSGAEGFTVEMWCDSVLACLWKRMLGGCPWSCCDVASGWLDVLYVYRFYVVRACGVLFGDVLCFADRSLRCFWRFVARLFLDVLRLVTVLLFCSVVIISSALQVTDHSFGWREMRQMQAFYFYSTFSTGALRVRYFTPTYVRNPTIFRRRNLTCRPPHRYRSRR